MSTHQTKQRKAITEAILHAPGPLRPNEIQSLAQEQVPRLGIATVYRTINLLMESGEIQAVPIAANDVRYEPTGRGHHHHFLCQVQRPVLGLQVSHWTSLVDCLCYSPLYCCHLACWTSDFHLFGY